ncbi:MAG: Calx-beta domain-containing protein, partial [Methylococcaceae bacterium]
GRDALTGVESVVFADKRVVDLTQGLTLSINNLSQPEGTGADSRFNFTVSLSAASTAPVSVNYSVEGGTATVGTDFTALSSVLTFAPNETQKTLSVPVKADSQVENDETFSVVLSNPVGASLVQARGNGTIQNDDLAVVSMASLSIKEGNSGTQDALLTVSLSTPITQTVTVNYATADGTALADSDYTQTTGQVTFTPGSTRQTIKIPVIGDSVVEADERFQVLLTNPLNAVLDATTASATVTLVNDDQITLQISSDKQNVKVGQSAALTFAFSDAPKGFETGDIQVSGGRVENVVAAPDGKTYTTRFVPAENQNSVNGLVSVAAGSYTDTQGKAGVASNSLTFTGDTLAPGLTLSSDKTSLKAGETANVTFTFSETPTGFEASDVVTTGG